MFTDITHPHYLRANGREYFWQPGEDASSDYLLADALLGSEVIRVRLLRGTEVTHIHRHLEETQLDIVHYQLADLPVTWQPMAWQATPSMRTMAVHSPISKGPSHKPRLV